MATNYINEDNLANHLTTSYNNNNNGFYNKFVKFILFYIFYFEK
jgi:hypothetical protein